MSNVIPNIFNLTMKNVTKNWRILLSKDILFVDENDETVHEFLASIGN